MSRGVVMPQTRAKLEELLKKRFFYAPAFSIYGGVGGLYDLGPPGCALQISIVSEWRKHFVIEEDMLEIDSCVLTPHDVLKTSGHVDRFCDWMVRDTINGDVYRADHLLKARLGSNGATSAEVEAVDGMDFTALEAAFKKLNIRSDRGNELSTLTPFNLMFGTEIGPGTNLQAYLRPETAQGLFVNYRRLLAYNNDEMPFAAATVGRAFRNEISPRASLLRVREFLMAEIEHFVDPKQKSHPKFSSVSMLKLPLLSRAIQDVGSDEYVEMEIGSAVSEGTVNNETLGYFLIRIFQFLVRIGIPKEKIRFRQHRATEMAHYASDCWDAEIMTSYGWGEVVGCADRAAYDLTGHTNRTGEKLVARKKLSQPEIIEPRLVIDKGALGRLFRNKAIHIEKELNGLSLEKIQSEIDENGFVSIEDIQVPCSMLRIQAGELRHVVEYVPSVIEPSFGIGRILYSLIEASYYDRGGERCVLAFPPFVAPIKVLVASLGGTDCELLVCEIAKEMRRAGLAIHVDQSSTSIGRKYARADEIGTPFAVTVDFRSIKDKTVTIRERDSMAQVRVSIGQVVSAVISLIDGSSVWGSIGEHVSIDAEEKEIA